MARFLVRLCLCKMTGRKLGTPTLMSIIASKSCVINACQYGYCPLLWILGRVLDTTLSIKKWMCILTPSGLKKWPQMPIMTISEIETTSKVSLKLTSRINLGRRGVPGPSSRLCTQTTSPPPPPAPHTTERAIPGQQRPIRPTGTINTPPPRTAKAAQNGNHRPCLKSKPQVKCHLNLPAG